MGRQVSLFHQYCLAVRAQSGEALPHFGQGGLRFVNAFTLTVDVAGVRSDAVFQAGDDAFSLVVELRRQSAEQFCAQVEHLFFKIIFGLFALEWDHEKAQDGQGAGSQNAGDV